jgi:uncharacterized membrane protein YfcA
MNYLLAAVVGLVGGLTSGLFGVGGGIIMVPALILWMQLDARAAIATSLAVIVPTTLASSVMNHAAFGRIDWRLVAALALPAIVGGLATTWFKEQIPSDLLKRLFGGFLLLVGGYLVLGK